MIKSFLGEVPEAMRLVKNAIASVEMNRYFQFIDEASFKNTMDAYSGEWSSFPMYSRFIWIRDLFQNSGTLESVCKGFSDNIFRYNHRLSFSRIVGVEYNYFAGCVVEPHIDNVNIGTDRIRVLMNIDGCDLIVTVGKDEYAIPPGEYFAFDCTQMHSGRVNGVCRFLIVDLLPAETSIGKELEYNVHPLKYYLEKMV